ncbi:helix-turn-helix domain-containing protein [Fictibacillus phosphorivorans]|uniref:helix-turn-helix domain-containing protein n=1 Tax=Fictibacillus phosphorivorans TaxID=1221500 RepID=UPI0011A557A7|nr:helix-turn-helix transcriptional regulator [Fictibacillus phosphorivorans]
MSEFGQYLKELRGKKSIREVARDVGISHTYLTTLEKGFDPRTKKLRKPNIDVLKRIASYYGVPTADLINRAGYKYEPSDFIPAAALMKVLENYKTKEVREEYPVQADALMRVLDNYKIINDDNNRSNDLYYLLQTNEELYFKNERLTDEDKKKILTLIHTLLN